MYFSLEIESNNDAMKSQQDVIVALQLLILQLSEDPELSHGPNMGSIKDTNGNTVGHWLLKI